MNPLQPRTPGQTVEGMPATGGPSPFPAGVPHAVSPGGAPEPPRFNWQVRRSLRMRPLLAAGVGAAVCLALVFAGFSQGRVYKAESRVFVDPLVPGSISPSNGQAGYDQFRYGSYLDQQIQTVTRADILTAALRSVPVGTWRGPNESEQAAVARLQKALLVERLTDGYEFSIKLSTANPEASAALLNAVTRAYLQGGRKDELTQADGREQTLLEERQRVKEALEADQKEQAALGTNLGVANPASESGNPFDASLTNLRTQLEAAREAHDVAAAQLSSMGGADQSRRDGLVAAANDSINTDAGLSSMKSSINQRRAVLEGLMANMTPGNPLYKQDQDELADLDRLLNAETVKMRGAAERRIQDKLRADLQRTASVEAQLNGELAQQTGKATSAGPKLLRASELATDIKRLNERYTEVDATLHTLELQTNGPGMAHVTLLASVPAAPEPNRSNLFLLAALPMGLLCGVGSAVLARLRDKRVYVGADVEDAVGFAPLAVLPASADVPARVLDEYMLRLAAGVEGAYRTASARTFLVSGVSGVSDIRTLVEALRGKLEELRLNVLVLRAAELLMTSKETAEHTVALAHPHAREGIATAKLERLKHEYDLVLIDAEPLLHAAETEYAARCADATILVAESGVTRSDELVQATALLSRLRVSGVALALDQVRLRDADVAFKAAVDVVGRRSLEAVPPRRTPVPQAIPVAETSNAEGIATLPEQPFEAPVAPAPSSAALEIEMPAELPYVPNLFLHPGVQPIAPEEKIAARSFRRESDYEDPSSADPRISLLRPVARGAKRADGTAIPSIFSSEQPRAEQVAPELPQSAVPERLEAEPVVSVSERQEEPSYTRSRSKIRFAFKEERVDSKTTWFSKLFRGDPPSSFKIVPDDEEDTSADGEWTPMERHAAIPPAPPISETLQPVLPHPVFEPQAYGELTPLSARRPAPQAPLEDQQPVAVAAGHFGAYPEPMVPPIAQPTVAPPPVAAVPPPEAEPIAEPQVFARQEPSRPLRPYSFQQLAGEPMAQDAQPIPEAMPLASLAPVPQPVFAARPQPQPAPQPQPQPMWPEKADVSGIAAYLPPVAARAPEPARKVEPEPYARADDFAARPMLQRLASRLEAVPLSAAYVPAAIAFEAAVPADPVAAAPVPGLSRRWALLSQYVTDAEVSEEPFRRLQDEG